MKAAERGFGASDAVRANLCALADVLAAASERAGEAASVISNCAPHNRDGHNQAMGCVAGLVADLETALALYRASVALHVRGMR